MSLDTKIECPRCNGSGHFSFNLLRGTVCFKCDGVGYVWVNAEKHEKAKKAKSANDAKRLANMAERVEAGAKRSADLHEKYKADSRLGSAILERMKLFEAVRYEVYDILDKVDNGGNIHSSVVERLANNLPIPLDVPFKEKNVAREAGAKWNSVDRIWEWPESCLPLPLELEKYKKDD